MTRLTRDYVRDGLVYRWRERGYAWRWIAARFGISEAECRAAYARCARTMGRSPGRDQRPPAIGHTKSKAI